MQKQLVKVRAVRVRFLVTTLPALASNIEVGHETVYDLTRKLNSATGVSVIDSDDSRSVNCTNLLSQIENAGFVLVSVSIQKQLSNSKFSKVKYVVNFHFVPMDVAIAHAPNFSEHKIARSLFSEFISMNYWHLMAFENPGEEKPWLSIACNNRVQRYKADDMSRPIMKYDRDSDGEKAGEPYPLPADSVITFDGASVTLN